MTREELITQVANKISFHDSMYKSDVLTANEIIDTVLDYALLEIDEKIVKVIKGLKTS